MESGGGEVGNPIEFVGGGASMSIPGAMAKMMADGSTMTGQENDSFQGAGPMASGLSGPKTSMRSEARHFVAEQECDDLRELTIRAKNYAERTASTLPASQYRTFVASFVDAVRNEYRVAARDYSYDHYMEYARRNGLHPGDSLTVDRYSRENSVPQERASAYAMQFNKSANIKIATALDFPAEFMYME